MPLLKPTTREPRNHESNRPSHRDTNAYAPSQPPVTDLLLLTSRAPDHCVLLQPDHRERRRDVPGGLVLGVEGVGVVDAEGVALAGIAASGHVGDVEEGVGEVVLAGREVPADSAFINFCGRFC